MTRILDDLNPAQREAVVYGQGPLMVLAGAGSGKTRVITRRIAWLLHQGVPPGQILALTFTNKAAGEMVRRVEILGGFRVHVSTFHSACARFLRSDGHLLDYPRDFSIYDTYDRNACIKQLMRRMDLEIDKVRPSQVGTRISRLKNLNVAPGDFVPGLADVDTVVHRVFGPYQQRMQALGAMDFDDLLLRFRDLLLEFPDVAELYQDRFRWLLVDEFQDTNLVQYELVKLLTAKHHNICVVGDPDQSIYKFRGAELRNILDFENDHEDTEIIRMETNYRSTGCILAAAQAIIENNRDRMDKALHTEGGLGEPLTICRASSEEEEAAEVVQQVGGLLAAGTIPDEIAVFYRAHFLSRVLEQALRQLGLPYEIVGGLSFFERREIKDLIAYLRVVINPLDDVSMQRIINVPPRGVGKVSLGKLERLAAENGMSLVEAVMDPDSRGQLKGKAKKGLEELAAALSELRADGSAAEALQKFLEHTDYLDYACGLGDPEDVSRVENIQELVNDALQYGREHDDGLAGYLQHVSLLTSEDRSEEEGPRVSLMTVHSAKGLEFDHVFVVGLEEGVFPHIRSLDRAADLEEERRLMYVAITRARKTVFLSYSVFRMVAGMSQHQAASRFLDEIPDDCVERAGALWHRFDAEDGSDYVAEDDCRDINFL